MLIEVIHVAALVAVGTGLLCWSFYLRENYSANLEKANRAMAEMREMKERMSKLGQFNGCTVEEIEDYIKALADEHRLECPICGFRSYGRSESRTG